MDKDAERRLAVEAQTITNGRMSPAMVQQISLQRRKAGHRRAVAASRCPRLIRAALTVDIFYIPARRDRRL